jgi:hypothetical protein
MNGSLRGYALWARNMMEASPGGKHVHDTYLRDVLKARRPAPLWMVVVLTRIATEEPLMTRDEAVALAGEFFTTTDPREAS